MPYVNTEQRTKYKSIREALKALPTIETKGDLEYLGYLLMLKFMHDRKRSYSTLHDTVYAMKHTADEFKRINLDKREDEAKAENGDIEL